MSRLQVNWLMIHEPVNLQSRHVDLQSRHHEPVNMQSRHDGPVNLQSRHDEHEQCTEDEDSDYEMNESYFVALRNQLRREEYLKVITLCMYLCMYVIMYHIKHFCPSLIHS